MYFAIKGIVKPSPMATINGCINSIPSLNASYNPKLVILSKPPFKLNLSCSFSPSPLFTLRKKKTILQTIVSVLAAPQEEGNFNWGSQETSENEQDGVGGNIGDEFNEDAKVFVGSLPYDVDSEKLAHLFEQAGIVEIAEVIYNRETEQSRGFGFVTMSTVEEADRAVEMLSGYEFKGRILTVNKAAPRGSRPERPPRVFEPSYRIYAGNLPWSVDDSRLEQVFSEHGKVINARVVYDRESGRSRGFGFVTMSSESEVNDAIANLDGQTLDGRTIRVNIAEGRPRRM